MRTRFLVLAALIGCGHDEPAAAPAPAAKPPVARAPAVAPPVAPPAAPVPATDLLSAIPADAAFVAAMLDPIPEALWQRVLPELDPAAIQTAAAQRAASSLDPVTRLKYAVWAELAAALAAPNGLESLGVRRQPRLAVYAAGRVPVVRIELADPARAGKTIDRITGVTPTDGAWTLDAGAQAIAFVIANRTLAMAIGPRDAVHALAPHLGDAAPHPLDEATLRTFAADHHLTPYGVGWVDPGKLVAILKTPGVIPELDAVAPRCRTETLAAIGSLPTIAFGWSELSKTRWALTLGFATSATTADAVAKAMRDVPALPAVIPGHPLIAASLAAPPPSLAPAWIAPFERAERACGDKPDSIKLPAPWNSLKAGALVIYDGNWVSFLPGAIDGYLGVTGDAAAIVAALGAWVPKLAASPPKDGGGFVDVMMPSLAAFVPDLAIARKGSQLFVATGPAGKAHVRDLVPRDHAPVARVFVDVARLRERAHAADLKRKLDDDETYRGDETFSAAAGLDSAFSSLVGTLDVTFGGGDDSRVGIQIEGTFAPPHPRAAQPAADPRFAVRDQCRAILHKALAATRPALEKLGVTTDLDGIASTYLTSIQADGAIRSCAKLTAAQRSCIVAAPDPLSAVATCAPGDGPFHDSKLELPPLFSFFGPKPLEAKLHPKIDGAALRAKLAGTWTGPSGTWVIDAAGHATIKRAGETRRRTLVFEVAGKVQLDEGDGSSETESFHLLGPDRFITDGDPVPIAAETHFIAPLGDGYLIREPTACSVVTREGRLVPAHCAAKTVDGERELDVEWATCADAARCGQHETYHFLDGWVVDRDVRRDAFVRRR